MSVLLILVVVGLGGFIFIRRHQMDRLEKQKNMIDQYLYRLKHFIAFKQYIGIDGCSGIAIDENRKEFCFVTNNNGIVRGKIFIYSDIVSSKILEDGQHMVLHIITKDIEQPNHIVNFMNIEMKKDGSLYKGALKEIQYWHSLLSTIINQVEEAEKVPKINPTEIKTRVIAH